MTVQPAVTTCREASCRREYRLGKETHVYFSGIGENFFTTTCPFCGTRDSKPISDPEKLHQSLVQCNNFSSANPVLIFGSFEDPSLDGLLLDEQSNPFPKSKD